MQLHGVDSIETSWLMTTPLTSGGAGTAYAEVEAPTLARETAVYVHAVAVDDVVMRLPEVSFSICDPDQPLSRSDDDVIERYREIRHAQASRYDVSLGDSTTSDAQHYRVAFVVEDLLLTTPMRLPGIRAFGLEGRPDGADAEKLVIEAKDQLGWVATPLHPNWTESFRRDHPVAVLACDSVFARDYDGALAISTAARDELLSVLALNRGAAGRPVVTMLEKREDAETVAVKFRFDHRSYGGNLAGGFLSGENQSHLLVQHAALRNDPLLKLCVDLYAEALADRSEDAKYFRFWSALETLAISRVPDAVSVTRLDGTGWPGNLTTSKAAPRVYTLIAETIFQGPDLIDEASFVQPAADLFEAVKNWYARRNATAHYGKFIPGDSVQLSQHWYTKALATVPAQGQIDEWLRTLQEVCASVLNAEMARVGKQHIS